MHSLASIQMRQATRGHAPHGSSFTQKGDADWQASTSQPLWGLDLAQNHWFKSNPCFP